MATNVSEMIENVTTTTRRPIGGEIGSDNATWVLISTFIIFTMQSGFGLLESGCVSVKNQVNIMYKNATDVIFGGLVYWLVGYGLSFGDDEGTNAFCSVGYWAIHVEDPYIMGDVYTNFVFQLSFASTAATIVSGAMAERVKLHSYIIYASLNVFVYCIPAHWVWHSKGFLNTMGIVDIAGSGVVHLCGGTAALVSSLMLGPRKGRYDGGTHPPAVGNGTNIILGTFFLWWGWLGFNCGSTFGVQGGLWVSAAKVAACTLIASMGGGVAGLFFSVSTKSGIYSISDLCNGILGGLVGVTAPCAVVVPWEAFIIGLIGGIIACSGTVLFDRLKIDDPVGAISVHGLGGIWGLVSVGLFMNDDKISGLNNGQVGAFHGGGGYSLGIQLLGAVCIIVWSGGLAFIITGLLRISPLGLRMGEEEETRGADFWEHGMINNVEQYAQRRSTAKRRSSLHDVRAMTRLRLQDIMSHEHDDDDETPDGNTNMGSDFSEGKIPVVHFETDSIEGDNLSNGKDSGVHFEKDTIDVKF